jgi:acylphosphatase
MIRMQEKKTRVLHLEGVVQGVGMRFFVKRSAKKYGVNGFVKNLQDGSVECLIQADQNTLNEFILHIKRRSPGNIQNIREDALPNHDTVYKDFKVSF